MILNVYAVKDSKEKLFGRGIFCAPNDLSARRMLANTISKDLNPIGIPDKFLVQIGTFDEDLGIIMPNEKNVIKDVCCLIDIFNDVLEEMKKYGFIKK